MSLTRVFGALLQIILIAAGVYIGTHDISLLWFYSNFAMFVVASLPSWRSILDDDGTWWTWTMGITSALLTVATIFLSLITLNLWHDQRSADERNEAIVRSYLNKPIPTSLWFNKRVQYRVLGEPYTCGVGGASGMLTLIEYRPDRSAVFHFVSGQTQANPECQSFIFKTDAQMNDDDSAYENDFLSTFKDIVEYHQKLVAEARLEKTLPH